MKRFLGFLMCLPMLTVLVAASYWSYHNPTGQKVALVVLTIIAAFLLIIGIFSALILIYNLGSSGLRMLFKNKDGSHV